MQQTIDEYTTRVGQQAVVMFVTPGKPNNSYKVFGAKPLEDVVSRAAALSEACGLWERRGSWSGGGGGGGMDIAGVIIAHGIDMRGLCRGVLV